jgi:hypothetical protein
VSVSFDGGSGAWWNLDFAPSQGGEQLGVGVYEDAERFPFQSPTSPGLSVSGSGRGCNTLTGRFEVLELEITPGGDVARLAVDFEQHCERAGRRRCSGPCASTPTTSRGSWTPTRTGSSISSTTARPIRTQTRPTKTVTSSFCGGLPVSTREGRIACRRADWRNDEPAVLHPRDCFVYRGGGLVRCLETPN